MYLSGAVYWYFQPWACYLYLPQAYSQLILRRVPVTVEYKQYTASYTSASSEGQQAMLAACKLDHALNIALLPFAVHLY